MAICMNYDKRARVVAHAMFRWMAMNEEGWYMDQQVDGGEWSGPAQHKMEHSHRVSLCVKHRVTVLAAQDAEYEICMESEKLMWDDVKFRVEGED